MSSNYYFYYFWFGYFSDAYFDANADAAYGLMLLRFLQLVRNHLNRYLIRQLLGLQTQINL